MLIIAALIVSIPLWLIVYGLDLIQLRLEGITNCLDDIDNQLRRNTP
jgi:hypothetical protein